MSIRPLPLELQQVAENELNEKPNEIQENIRIIKEWITKEPHLRARTDDQWILTYLRGCKHRIQKTKEKIDYYYSLRATAPEIFGDRYPTLPEIKDVFNKKILIPLPTIKNGPQGFLTRLGAENIDHIPLVVIIKAAGMMLDVALNENDYLMMGQVIICDLKGMSFFRTFELTLDQVKVFALLQEAYPLRPQCIVVLNLPTIAHKLFQLTKMLVGKKTARRMHSWQEVDLEQLRNFFPTSILPKEYGGEASIDEITDYWKQKMEDYTDWFLEDAAYGTDESKRIQTNFGSDYGGVEGSFRKLEID